MPIKSTGPSTGFFFAPRLNYSRRTNLATVPNGNVEPLIREHRRRVEQDQFGPLVLKRLSQGELTPHGQASLPAGLIDRLQHQLERKLFDGNLRMKAHLIQPPLSPRA